MILRTVQEGEDSRLDKTFGEIKSAFNSGRPMWGVEEEGEDGIVYISAVTALFIGAATGGVITIDRIHYTASTDEGYPLGLR